MSNTKYILSTYSFYDHAGIEHKLEEMAAKGWQLDKMGGIFWRFRSAAPEKLHFSVTYFPAASEFDPHPSEAQEIFTDFCERSGWVLLMQQGQRQIYCNRRENPVPIDTDALTQVEPVHKVMKKSALPSQLIMLILCLWQLVFSYFRFQNDPIAFLSTPSSLYMVPAWILFLIECLIELGFYVRWYRRAKRLALETGEFLRIRASRTVSLLLLTASALIIIAALIGSKVVLWVTFLWCGLLVAISFGANALKNILKRRNVSRSANLILTVAAVMIMTTATLLLLGWSIIRFNGFTTRKPVDTYDFHGYEMEIYNDPLPLYVEDLTGAEGHWNKEMRKNESFLLAQTEYCQDALPMDDNDVPDIRYTVIDVKFPALYDLCLDSLLSANEDWPEEYRDYYAATDSAPWGAEEAYRYFSHDGSPYNRFLLCYEERIITVRPSWDMDETQMALVGKTLG